MQENWTAGNYAGLQNSFPTRTVHAPNTIKHFATIHIPTHFLLCDFLLQFFVSSQNILIVILLFHIVFIISFFLSIYNKWRSINSTIIFFFFFWGGGGGGGGGGKKLSASPFFRFFSFLSLSFIFFFIFWASKHPPRMTTRRMVG